MAVEELTALEKCLGLKAGKYSSRAQGSSQIPVLQLNKGPSFAGLATIASHLVTLAKKEELLGVSNEEKAVVQQWLEYRTTHIDRLSSKEDIRTTLKDLNSYLEDKVYMAGNKITLADILTYYGLHPIIVSIFLEKCYSRLNMAALFGRKCSSILYEVKLFIPQNEVGMVSDVSGCKTINYSEECILKLGKLGFASLTLYNQITLFGQCHRAGP